MDKMTAILLLGVALQWPSSASALQIDIAESGKTVSQRKCQIHATVSDQSEVRSVKVEVNGNSIELPHFEPDSEIELTLPVSLNLGTNLIGVRAETDRNRTSILATITYDGADDEHDPAVLITSPALTDNGTADSTITVYGYAYDDVKIAEVTVEGRQTLPWSGSGSPADEGSKDLVVEEMTWAHTDSIAFQSPSLPLSIGWNTLRIEARDHLKRTTLKTVKVFRQPAFEGDRWAVVVGVSKYTEGIQNLRFADDDARAFHEFLLSPRGGKFKPEHTRLLIDEQATSQALRDALWVFLRKAKQDDFVVFYFSGHGSSEPGGASDILYLLTHDADPERLPSTAFAFHDLERALQHYIASERVLIIADACHSGGITQPSLVAMKDSEAENELVYRYLQELSDSAPGRAVFTASESNEKSREGKEWGDGHGVFTHYLLEAMRGKADSDRNGVVTLGEAIEFTRSKVQEATGGMQHPDPGGEFDRSMPLSVIRAN